MGNKCCFLGYEKIEKTQRLEKRVYDAVENLIVHNGTDIFVFFENNEFNDLCYDVVQNLKQKYPYILKFISGNENYSKDKYDFSYCAESQNCVLESIDGCRFCVAYYDINKNDDERVKKAYDYARENYKVIINTH